MIEMERKDDSGQNPAGEHSAHSRPALGPFLCPRNRVLAEIGHSRFQNRPLLDSKTEFNGLSGTAKPHEKSCRPPSLALLNFGLSFPRSWGRFFPGNRCAYPR